MAKKFGRILENFLSEFVENFGNVSCKFGGRISENFLSEFVENF